ncbi:hypothetical protein Syun_017315 [Stephania yunnanensis]|uniref:Uncharacterized protein n=1 Tax=Stephania yunnanensis TaxID=152371 RepID=A0AAP0J6T6_9MAGN
MNMNLTKEYTGGKAVKDRRRTGEGPASRDKRARRVTFEGSSRDSGGSDGGGRYDGRDETKSVVAGMAAGDGEGSVGGGSGWSWWRRTVEDGGGGDGGGQDGLWTVEGGLGQDGGAREKRIASGTVDAGRWRRGRWSQDDLDEARGEQRRGEISVAEEENRTRGTRERPLCSFLLP